jgi:hypothetical protein
MHTDTQGEFQNNPMLCGEKFYSTGLLWLTVLSPADPLSQNFELQVTTNDYLLAGVYSINLVIGFIDPTFTAVLTQVISVTLLHPCKLTLITTTQTIADIVYTIGDPTTLTPFTAFSDTVSSEYSEPGLCGLVYSLSPASDATKFGVSIVAMNISVSTINLALLG